MKARHYIATVFALLLVAGCGSNISNTNYVESAKDHLDKNDLRAAAIQLKSALQQNPNDPEARWLLGKVNLEIGDFAAAEKELKRALDLGVSEIPIRPLLAQAYNAQAKHTETLALPTTELAPAAQALILSLQSDSLLAQQKPEEAQQKIDQALLLQPNSAPAATQQARLQLSTGDNEAAIATIKQLLSHDAAYAPAWSLKGDIERRMAQFEDAEQSYTNAIKHRFNHFADRLKRALVQIELKKFAQAQDDINILMQQAPNYYELHHAQGVLHFYKGEYPQAQTALERSFKANDQYLPTQFYLGATHLQLGQIVQAEHLISRYVSTHPRHVPGRLVLAQIRLQEGQLAEVENLVQPIINADPENVTALNLLAGARIQQQRYKESIDLFSTVTKLAPESADAHLRLASALFLQGDELRAINALTQATKLDNQTQLNATKLLVQHYLNTQQLDKALAQAQELLSTHKKSAEAYNIIGLVYLARKENDLAKKAFETSVSVNTSDITANQYLASLAVLNENLAAARQYYQAILKGDPSHLDTLMKLASLADRDSRADEMKNYLQQAIEAHPNAIQPRTSLARHYLGTGHPEQVSIALGPLPQTHFDNVEVVEVLGLAQLEQGLASDAVVTLKRLVTLLPDSANAHYLLSQAYSLTGDTPLIKKNLESAIALNPEHLPGRIALTRLLVQQNDSAADSQLKKLVSLAADNPDVRFLQAQRANAKGQPEKALAIYQDLHTEHPSTRHVTGLSQQLWDMNQQSAAIGILEQWLRKTPSDIIIRNRLASAYTNTNQVGNAIKEYKEILKQTPNNLIALNNAATLTMESDPKQSLKYAEKAVSISPTSPTLNDTLASALARNGDLDRALRANQTAIDNDPQNISLKYKRARLLNEMQHTDKAAALLKEILSENASFIERKEAEQLLKQLSQ